MLRSIKQKRLRPIIVVKRGSLLNGRSWFKEVPSNCPNEAINVPLCDVSIRWCRTCNIFRAQYINFEPLGWYGQMAACS